MLTIDRRRRMASAASFVKRFEPRDHVILVKLFSVLSKKGGDDAVARSLQRQLQLHALDRYDRLALLDLGAFRLVDRDDRTRHWRPDGVTPAGRGLGCGTPINDSSLEISAAKMNDLAIADMRPNEWNRNAADLDCLTSIIARPRRRHFVLAAVDADHEMGPASNNVDLVLRPIDQELEGHV